MLTPDEQAQGNLSLGNEVVNPTGQSNGTGGSVVRRYTDPSGAMGVPAPTPPVPGPANPLNSLLGNQQLTNPSITDEQQQRDSIAKSMQSQVDQTNQVYNNYVGATLTHQANNRLGAVTAQDARSGTTGTNIDTANQANTQDYNKKLLDQSEAERQQKLGDISNTIEQRTQAEIAARKADALGNRGAYAKFLGDEQDKARQNLKDIAANGGVLSSDQRDSLIRHSGLDPMTFDAVYNANKTQGTGISYNYTNLGNGSVLRTGKMANGQAVPEQKFQYDLGPNDEFQVTQNGTPLIVSKNGNNITSVKVAPGFQEGDLASKYQIGTTFPGSTQYKFNTLTGQYEQLNGGSTPGTGGGPLVSSNPNPAAVVNGYDLTSYASGNKVGGPASQAANVTNVYNKLPNITDSQSASAAIQSIKPGSPITGDMVMQAAHATGVDPKILISVMQAETQLGTDNSKGSQQFNYGNVGNTDSLMASGGSKGFSGPLDGVMAVAQNLAKRQIGGTGSTPAVKPYNASDPTDAAAMRYIQDPSVKPTGNGKTSATPDAIYARANDIYKTLGLGEFNPALVKAENKASVASLVDTQGQRDQISTNLTTADNNFKLLQGFMQQNHINSSQSPIVNQAEQALGKFKGTGAYYSFSEQIQGLKNEYSQILAKGGTATDSVRSAADNLVPDKISPADLQVVVDWLQKEGQNVLASKDKTINDIKGRLNTTGSPKSSSANDPLGIR